MAITVEELSEINHKAYALALKIIGECGDEDDGTPDPEEFRVFVDGTYILQWADYGPFNPVPEWAWDPETEEWVDPEESDEAYERFNELRNI